LLCGERSNIGLQQGEKLFIRALFFDFFLKKGFFFPKKQEYTTMQNETQKNIDNFALQTGFQKQGSLTQQTKI